MQAIVKETYERQKQWKKVPLGNFGSFLAKFSDERIAVVKKAAEYFSKVIP